MAKIGKINFPVYCFNVHNLGGHSVTDLEIMIAARELITDPVHWTRGANARNKDRKPVLFNSEDAVCWCARGAVMTVAPFDSDYVMPPAYCGPSGNLTVFNDNRMHAEVLSMFDNVIADLQKEVAV